MWYRDNSKVFVSSDHACWADPDLTRKVNKRRFGGVKRSSVSQLNSMMEEHAEETREWILERLTVDHGDTTESDIN